MALTSEKKQMDFFSSVFDNQSVVSDDNAQFDFMKQESSKQKENFFTRIKAFFMNKFGKRKRLNEIKKYEEEIQKLNLSKAVRIQIDRYVSAVNWRWVLCWDFLYRSGMKDILLLFENR